MLKVQKIIKNIVVDLSYIHNDYVIIMKVTLFHAAQEFYIRATFFYL